MIQEVWKDVVGYEGLYQVSNLGRVKSFCGRHRKGTVMKSRLNHAGYSRIGLWKNDEAKTYSVHRLVCEAFIKNPDRKTQINHKNCIKDDNCVENIEWCTPSENIKHAYSNNLLCQVGGLNNAARLSEFQVKRIKLMKEITPKTTNVAIGKMFNVTESCIRAVIKGRNWAHIT